MSIYRSRLATEGRLLFGQELALGLAEVEQTQQLVPVMQSAQDDLPQAHKTRAALDEPLIAARVKVKFAELKLERALRALHGVCKEKDGSRVGPVTDAIFPNGLSPAITPKGAAQRRSTEQLHKRIDESNLAALVQAKAELLAKLDPAWDGFKSAHSAYEAAAKARNDAFFTEGQRRNDHRRTVQSVFGQIEGALPGDKQLHDTIAPEVNEPTTSADPEPEEPGTPEKPPGE